MILTQNMNKFYHNVYENARMLKARVAVVSRSNAFALSINVHVKSSAVLDFTGFCEVVV